MPLVLGTDGLGACSALANLQNSPQRSAALTAASLAGSTPRGPGPPAEALQRTVLPRRGTSAGPKGRVATLEVSGKGLCVRRREGRWLHTRLRPLPALRDAHRKGRAGDRLPSAGCSGSLCTPVRGHPGLCPEPASGATPWWGVGWTKWGRGRVSGVRGGPAGSTVRRRLLQGCPGPALPGDTRWRCGVGREAGALLSRAPGRCSPGAPGDRQLVPRRMGPRGASVPPHHGTDPRKAA